MVCHVQPSLMPQPHPILTFILICWTPRTLPKMTGFFDTELCSTRCRQRSPLHKLHMPKMVEQRALMPVRVTITIAQVSGPGSILVRATKIVYKLFWMFRGNRAYGLHWQTSNAFWGRVFPAAFDSILSEGLLCMKWPEPAPSLLDAMYCSQTHLARS